MLYVSLWNLVLRNLPVGTIQHRLIGAEVAGELVRSARKARNLRCGAALDDLAAPYKAKSSSEHAQLCEVLSDHLQVPIRHRDFFVKVGERKEGIFPIDAVTLRLGDRLMVVDCSYTFSSGTTGDLSDRFVIAEDTIEFHLFELILRRGSY